MPPIDEISLKTLSDIINSGVSSQLVYEGSVCDTYPCWNDGLCVESNQTLSGYLCLCNDMFTGDHCQIKISDNNCSKLTCPQGTFCPPGSPSCLPMGDHTMFPSCLINPCLNKGLCVIIGESRHRCLCPEGFHGLMCQASTTLPPATTLSGLQTLFIFSIFIFLIAGLLIFCYGGDFSCYLLMPGKKRYTKWVEISEDLSWDNMEEEEEYVVGGRQFFGRGGGQRTDKFEMRTRPLRISSTTETFVTYDPHGSTSNPSCSHQNPVEI